RASPELEYVFFDATTDLGVCTIYAMQIARSDPRVYTLVSCATGVNPGAAIAKTIRDLTHLRIAFRHERRIPSDWDDFADVLDGATLMSRASQSHSFDFLMRTPNACALSRLPAGEIHAKDVEARNALLRRLRRVGFDA